MAERARALALIALVAVLQLLPVSAPAWGQAGGSATLAATSVAPASPADRLACDAETEAPSLAASDKAPSLLAVATARHAPALPPAAVLVLVLEAPPDTASLGARQRTRPSEGLDVPACRSEQRWCIAHTTATSPA
jgi:hypothetical protein